MGVKKLSFFLISTVLFGSLFGGGLSALGLLVHISWYNGLVEGGLLATNCLMGFWAYLLLRFTISTTLPSRVWRWTQILVLLVVIYDMLFWRYDFATVNQSHVQGVLVTYLIQGLWPLVVAIIGGIIKFRIAGKGSFIPTVFFLYVFTVLDWVLVLKIHSNSIVNQTGVIMMVCNLYILFMYGKLLSKKSMVTIARKGRSALVPTDRPIKVRG